MTLPVGAMVLPTDLVGQANGEISQTLLTLCGIGNFKMHHLASRALRAMVAASPFIDSATGTYRSLADQITLFDGTDAATWHGPMGRYVPEFEWTKYLNSGHSFASPDDVRSWNGQRWKRRSNTASAAVPGTSNHGWGLAVDLAENNSSTSVSTAFVNWLITNAATYGFSAEMQSEAWHWRYISGDAIPKAVLDFENPTGGNMLKPRYLRQKGFLNVWIVGDGYPCMDLSGELKASIDAEVPGIEKVFFDNMPAFIGLCTMSGLNPHDPTQAIPGGSLTEF